MSVFVPLRDVVYHRLAGLGEPSIHNANKLFIAGATDIAESKRDGITTTLAISNS